MYPLNHAPRIRSPWHRLRHAGPGSGRRYAGWLALAFALTWAPLAMPDQTDERLDTLFSILQTTAERANLRRAEALIWQLWMLSGNQDIDRQLNRATEAMNAGQPETAVDLTGRIIARMPDFAEAWNTRATAYYMLEDYEASISDIERTLELEPRHFGALSGLGLIHLQRGDDLGALRAFEDVLRINPNATHARRQIQRLSNKLGSVET